MNIDWKDAPPDAQWWAMDANGKAYWFCAPVNNSGSLVWRPKAVDAPSFEFDGDWRHSLMPRPASRPERAS